MKVSSHTVGCITFHWGPLTLSKRGSQSERDPGKTDKYQRKFSLLLSVTGFYLDLYCVLMEVTVTPFPVVLSHHIRLTS